MERPQPETLRPAAAFRDVAICRYAGISRLIAGCRYYGGGAVYTGWSARRPSDQIGIAVAVAELGDPYRQALAQAGALTATREYNYELTYRFEVSDWLTLQSDLQYIRHPGMDPMMDSAWVVGLRLELSRGWAW